ncbi:hypothetical protein CDS [Bradyrhizobium sp.]|nr:hypothetical protein CDS [Bradyrhizobium sp.]
MAYCIPPMSLAQEWAPATADLPEFRSFRTGSARLPQPSKSTGEPQAYCLM